MLKGYLTRIKKIHLCSEFYLKNKSRGDELSKTFDSLLFIAHIG